VPESSSTVSESEPAPASFAQERLWFIEQLQPGNSAYVGTIALTLRGMLDVDALRSALAEIVRRHEVLRTNLRMEMGGLTQVVRASAAPDLAYIDRSEAPDNLRAAEIDEIARAEAERPFDLACDQLLRAMLIRLGATEHVLILCVHHIVCDGGSMQIFARELAALYAIPGLDRSAAIPPLPIQYGDYARSQRQRLASGAFDAQFAYWDRALHPVPAYLNLPVDRPAPGTRSMRGGRLTASIAEDVWRSFRALGAREACTPFIALLAAFQALLARVTGQSDIAVVTPVSGRTHIELENMIGLFLNLLVLRADVGGDLGFRDLLRAVRHTALDAYPNQEVPFERVIARLHPARDLGRDPMARVLLGLQHAAVRQPPALPGLELEWREIHTGDTRYDLGLFITEQDGRFECLWEYATDLFAHSSIVRLHRWLEALMRAVVVDPDRRLSSLQLFDEADRQRVFETWNATNCALPLACVHHLFEQQVARTPNAPAVCQGDTVLSYAALDVRANRLARQLRCLGVRPERRVAICLDRSVRIPLAVLAVWKAGGVYVPIAPELPPGRALSALADADVSVVITERALADRFDGTFARKVLLDGEPSAFADEEAVGDTSITDLDALAYIIYTSGSTGRPKGVAITHRALSNLLLSLRTRLAVVQSDVMFAVTSLSFDISAVELYLPLITGAKVVVARSEAVRDARIGVYELMASKATLMQATPSLWRALVDAGWEGDAGMRLLCGGEPLSRPLANELLGRGRALFNLYGPTETTVWSTCVRVGPGGYPPDVGGPLANTRVYILDKQLTPIPPGMPGELFIGGVGLARCYDGQAALTAEKFVPDPFRGGGERLYCTGDRARFGDNGRIELLGRLDGQLKLRGHRIEPAEIEAALAEHDDVAAAAIMVREVAVGDHRLTAYIVGVGNRSPDSDDLVAFLAHRLPPYMIPSCYVLIDELPRTVNGKLDRVALGVAEIPERSWCDRSVQDAGPGSSIEELVAGAWCDLIGTDRVGKNDDFFTIGGHSLLATRLLARLHVMFDVNLPLATMFRAPTVAGLAKEIQARRGSSPAPAPPTRKSRPGEPFPLSFAQQQIWFLTQLHLGEPFLNTTAAVRLEGQLDIGALQRSLSHLVDRHEVLRTAYRLDADGPVQVVMHSTTCPVPLPVSDIVSDSAEGDGSLTEVQGRITDEARRGFDLEGGLLLRAVLWRLGPRDHVLQLTIHHIAVDGWSIGILTRELGALYTAFAAGGESPLPALPLQYADYALWQRQTWNESAAQDQLKDVSASLAGALNALDLAGDGPRPIVRSTAGATHVVPLEPELVASLRAIGRRYSSTFFMSFVAAYTLLLRRRCTTEDIVLGADVAGRDRPELEELAGFFVNQVVLRLDLFGCRTFKDVLDRARRATLRAQDHRMIPFEVLVAHLRRHGQTSSRGLSPIFNVKLVLQERPLAQLRLAGLKMTPLDVDTGSARLDLTLIVQEDGPAARLVFEYSTDLYQPRTVQQMGAELRTVLGVIVERPDVPLSELNAVMRSATETPATAAARRRLKPVAADSRVRGEQLVRIAPLRSGAAIPIVMESLVPELDLATWATTVRPFLEQQLLASGALLLRGFHVLSAPALERFAAAVCPELLSDNGEHTRTNVAGRIYTPVAYPADRHLLSHNENTFNDRFPLKIWFCCVKPAAVGGETLIADSRLVGQRIDPGIRKLFAERGVMYIRRYGIGIGMDWQAVFGTKDRAAVERRCLQEGIQFDWKGDRLLTWCIRPGLLRHPRTDEFVWHNQAQHWHPACLDGEDHKALRAVFGDDGLPRGCRFGDGSPIDDSIMHEISAVYHNLEVAIPWQSGEVLMLDNLLTAHGRAPYTGERTLLIAMGELVSNGETKAGQWEK
jgi:amino acid adenylation domain-containing protein